MKFFRLIKGNEPGKLQEYWDRRQMVLEMHSFGVRFCDIARYLDVTSARVQQIYHQARRERMWHKLPPEERDYGRRQR